MILLRELNADRSYRSFVDVLYTTTEKKKQFKVIMNMCVVSHTCDKHAHTTKSAQCSDHISVIRPKIVMTSRSD